MCYIAKAKYNKNCKYSIAKKALFFIRFSSAFDFFSFWNDNWNLLIFNKLLKAAKNYYIKRFQAFMTKILKKTTARCRFCLRFLKASFYFYLAHLKHLALLGFSLWPCLFLKYSVMLYDQILFLVHNGQATSVFLQGTLLDSLLAGFGFFTSWQKNEIFQN